MWPLFPGAAIVGFLFWFLGLLMLNSWRLCGDSSGESFRLAPGDEAIPAMAPLSFFSPALPLRDF